MTDRLPMFLPTTCGDMGACTTLQESPGGTTPSISQVGETDLFGRAVVHVNRSAPPVRARRPMTNATSGPTGSGLSVLYDHQSSLANRLKRQLDGAGSTLFALTWKRKVTPRGRPYYQLAASGHRTEEIGFGSWRSPAAQNGDRGGQDGLERIAAGHTLNLQDQAMLASWPTPVALISPPAPWKDGQPWWQQSQAARNIEALASWPTPTQQDSASSGAADYSTESGRHSGTTLTDAARASWGTPMVGNNGGHGSPVRATDGKARLEDQVHGLISSGSPAATARRGQLNPRFSAWLQGYPIAWDMCAPEKATSSRRSSSAEKTESES
jgi:hypothetical protein